MSEHNDRFTEHACRQIADYYVKVRRVGHNTMMLDGVQKADVDAIVLVHTRQEEQIIKGEIDRRGMGDRVRITSLSRDVQRELAGQNRPLVIDTSALQHLLGDASDVIQKQRERIDKLTERLKSIERLAHLLVE